ncbi:MAG: hypothetical protein IT306_13740 [Chloroflexi bacterium]|nr:hypothetical protein [Chloroflexota bacterium]
MLLSTLMPSSATVIRADDEEVVVTPEAITPVPPPATATAAPATAAPATAAPAAATPQPRPNATTTPRPRQAAEADNGNGNDNRAAEPQPPLAACIPGPNTQPTTWRLEGNDALKNMRASIETTFRTVEAREMGLTGQFIGFRPGALYAHIYARDSATIAPTAQYFYELPWLTRPVEEFLALQYDGVPGDAEDARWRTPGQPGAVSGTVGGNEISGAKMLVVSDEEASVVSMAYVAVKAGAGPAWLTQQQAGKPRIQRLNEAMDWLFAHRFDQAFRLIKRGNTTDWGDVAVGVGHSSGEYVKEPSEWTASIYDQAWAYRALLQLAEMNVMVGQEEIAEHQRSRARLLRQASIERLWQADRGYFRTRLLLPPLAPEIDEDRIVSVANGIAVFAGLAEPSEHKPIFNALERARLEARAPKPGLTLWPAYPLGFFDYPQMTPGRYQNGAVWDWWGGMQVSGEFWAGYSSLGRKHLELVAQDWAREPGEIYEWQEMGTGKNLGSAAYTGAAASMGQAIISGLYGVELGSDGWEIKARLGAQSGGIHVFHPPSGCTLDYWHTYAGDRIAVEWETTHPNPGELRVTLPDNVKVDAALLDQKSVKVRTEVVGDDVYAVLPTKAPPGKHRLELRLVEAAE